MLLLVRLWMGHAARVFVPMLVECNVTASHNGVDNDPLASRLHTSSMLELALFIRKYVRSNTLEELGAAPASTGYCQQQYHSRNNRPSQCSTV